MTQCYEFASNDPTCSDYWIGEARYWEGQYAEAMKLTDQMINLAGHDHLPVRNAIPAPQAPTIVPFARLHKALLAAFDEAELKQLVRFELGTDLDQIANGHDLSERVFQLLSWAQRTNRVGELLAGARRQNGTNEELKALEGEWFKHQAVNLSPGRVQSSA